MNSIENQTLSDLIGLIYDAAQDANLWPLLLEGLTGLVNGQITTSDAPEGQLQTTNPLLNKIAGGDLTQFVDFWEKMGPDGTLLQQKLIANDPSLSLLSQHLVRALKINREMGEIRQQKDMLELILDQLPIGILVLDAQANLIAKNQQSDYIFGNKKALASVGRPIQLYSNADSKQLKKLVTALFEDSQRGRQSLKAMQLHRTESEQPLSAVLLPITSMQAGRQVVDRVLVMVAAPEAFGDMPLEILTDFYGLSGAEARLVQSLVKGMSTQEISDAFGVSKNTISTQLKSSFSKTGTRGQTDLVRHVLTHTGPMFLKPVAEVAESPAVFRIRRLVLGKNKENLQLEDGRNLSYSDSGPADGTPVILFHAIAGSRLQKHPDDTILHELGIRLIMPDRPGMGWSDSKPNRTLLSYADDIEALANALGFDRFHLVGYSVGGAFALAVTHRLGQRIIRLGLMASMAPFETMADLEGMIPLNHMVLSLGRYAPTMLTPFMHFMVKGVQRNPTQYFDRILQQIPNQDQCSLKNPVIRAAYIESMLEGIRQGGEGIVMEQMMVSRHWGFDLAEVHRPTLLWHGEEDRHVTLKMARSLAAQLPEVTTQYIAGAGHFLFYEYWRGMLCNLVGKPELARTSRTTAKIG